VFYAALREEYRLKSFEDRELKGTLVPVAGTGENCVLRGSTIFCLHLIMRETQTKREKWEGHVARTVNNINVSNILTGKPEINRSLGGSELRN
jgi:hypothetical protein